MAGFAFARLRFPGNGILFDLVLSTIMLPGIVTLIPTFIVFRMLHWINTFLPLTVPFWMGGGAFNIFLFRQFFMTIPRLDEAARIDGASNFRIYWNIILPLSKPVLATIAVFSFIHHWNDFSCRSSTCRTPTSGPWPSVSKDSRASIHQLEPQWPPPPP
ncbi:MAG: carbohydrate ABC transporter permease [Caldilineaceae bacterium]